MSKKIIPFKTFEDQLNEKIPEKNIITNFSSQEKSLLRLKNHSYYSLINGYKTHFLLPNESDKMRPNTTFEHFYACKMLEMDIGSIFLKYLLVVEQGFRNRVANVIADNFTTDETVYLSKDNYVNKGNNLKPLIELLTEKVHYPSENSYSFYFKKKYQSIPPWILILDLNFYDVITWYSCLEEPLRTVIRSEYLPLGKNSPQYNQNFINSMHFLREYRNIFAHSKRNFNEKIKHSIKKSYFNIFPAKDFNFPGNFDKAHCSKSLLSCTLMTLEYLIDDVLKGRFIEDLFMALYRDGHIDEEYKGINNFNEKTAYDILNLPHDFFTKINQIYNIKL